MPTPRPTLWVVLSYLVLFLGGGVVGVLLARQLAPGSFVAEVVGLFALPLAFAVGLQLWFGLALLSVLPLLLRRARTRATPAKPLPGGLVFLPLGSVAGLIAGVAVGALSATRSFFVVLMIFWLVGTLHGFAAWRLARTGYLMPPEEL